MISKYTNNTNFEKQLDILNKLLYSNNEDGFDSQKFVKLFKEVDKIKVVKSKKQDVLPNLYK
jgi:hypothetical protein